MKYYILFGPPGVGKGTQSKMLVKKYNYLHISTGDLLRSEIAKGSELGKEIATIIDAGNLVPDAMVVNMITDIFKENKTIEGFLVDGFPRTMAQAEILDELLEKMGTGVGKVISIKLSDDTIFERLMHRAEIEGRKDDMDKDVILKRIDTYHQKTEPLIEYYDKQNKYYEVDGSGTMEEVFKQITDIIH